MDAERASPLRVFRVKKQNIKHLLYLEFCSLFFRVPFRLRPRLAVNRESIAFFERSLSNGRHAFGNRYRGEAEAEVECDPSNGRHAVGNCHEREARATAECSLSNGRYAVGDCHGGEAFAAAKRTPSNGRDAVGNRIFGEALACRDLNKCFSVGSEQDTILALKMRIASGDTDLGQFRAKAKWTAVNGCHTVGNRYGREAFAEGERSCFNARYAVGDRHRREALAAEERARSNVCHAVGYRYRGEVLAASERLHSNDRHAVRDGDGGGCAGIFCDHNAVADDGVPEIPLQFFLKPLACRHRIFRSVCYRTCFFCWGCFICRSWRCHRRGRLFLEVDFIFFRVVFRLRPRFAVNREALAAEERARSNVCHAVGYRYRGEARAEAERSLSNGRDAFGDRYRDEAAEAERKPSNGRHAVGDRYGGEALAADERAKSNARNAVGNRYRGEVLAATERLHSNACYAVRDGDGGGCAGIFCDGDGTVVDFVFKFSVVEPFF